MSGFSDDNPESAAGMIFTAGVTEADDDTSAGVTDPDDDLPSETQDEITFAR